MFIRKVVEPMAKKKDPLHLTSFSIKEGMLPKEWPFIDILMTGSTLSQPSLTIEAEDRIQYNDGGEF